MMRMSVPDSSRWVVKLCRSVCTVTRFARPAAAQDAEQLGRLHDEAVLAALAYARPDQHPAAVDIRDLETDRLGGAQPRPHRPSLARGTGLHARNRFEKADDL